MILQLLAKKILGYLFCTNEISVNFASHFTYGVVVQFG